MNIAPWDTILGCDTTNKGIISNGCDSSLPIYHELCIIESAGSF